MTAPAQRAGPAGILVLWDIDGTLIFSGPAAAAATIGCAPGWSTWPGDGPNPAAVRGVVDR